jgi:uncharacterized membrane protein
MWRRRPESRIVLAIVSFLAIHVAIVNEAPATAVIIGLFYAAANLALDWHQGAAGGRRIVWLSVIGLLTATLAAIWLGYASAVTLLLAPSVLANLAMFYVFGNTLLPGKEPLITRFRRIDIGHVTPKFERYTRQLTVLWTVLFALGTVVSVAAAVAGEVELWSWIAFVLMPALSAALFLGEHVYRAYRYGAEERTSPLHTLSLMFHPQAWLPQAAAAPRGDNIPHG